MGFLNYFIFGGIFLSILFLARFLMEDLSAFIIERYKKKQDEKIDRITQKLEDSFIYVERKKIVFFSSMPLFLAVIGAVLLHNIIGALIGFAVGLWVPNILISVAKAQRLRKIQDQLVDSLLVLSSSLKAGLSFVQAIEILCDEMPPPITEEFKMVLKENKWGISLEESLIRLRKRVPLPEVKLLISSILIARESGGDLTKVISRLTSTIRDNIKLKEKIYTLTLQGKLQGWIMMVLPFIFAAFVYKQTPEHFDIMLQNPTGRLMLGAAIVAQIVGMIIIKKISVIKF